MVAWCLSAIFVTDEPGLLASVFSMEVNMTHWSRLSLHTVGDEHPDSEDDVGSPQPGDTEVPSRTDEAEPSGSASRS